MLTLRSISLSRGTKTLIHNVNLSLYEKQKIGLIGQNGCGKSTFFDFLLGKLIPDTGELLVNAKLTISHLSQQIPDSELPALDFVLSGDKEYTQIMNRLAEAEKDNNHTEVLACHEHLEQTGGYSKPALAASIMSGLGFSACDQKNSVSSFSGGWRMRLNLAKCLIEPADLLLLDEPTNHLDMEAIFWLERFLKQSPSTIILISHDREFLDGLVTHIVHVENQDMKLYNGNYSFFEKTYAEQLSLQAQTHKKQQDKIKHLMSFVNRFKAKATKAKQAQSRLKAIEKMELVAAAQLHSPFTFSFYPCPKANNPLIQCKQVSAGYNEKDIILKNINITLAPGSRIALVGPNGEGKSTLIKTLTGVLAPIAGQIYTSANIALGYYAQHQLEQLDAHLSPLQTIQSLDLKAKEQDIRNFLGGFNFNGDIALNPIKHFSGGEKARLALAKLVWQKPNLLLLDEPTNHLDLDMRAAIEMALQSYEGALILISHDRHLLKTSVDSFYLVYQQQVVPFEGDLADYFTWLTSKDIKQSQKQSYDPSARYKEKKSLQNRLKSLERDIVKTQAIITQLDAALANTDLYDNPSKASKLNELNSTKNEAQSKLLRLEEEWLDVSVQLEA